MEEFNKMRKLTRIALITFTILLFTSSVVSASNFTNPTSTNSGYNRTNAYNYMTQWTTTKNLNQYADFSGLGGDCTNYVSQVVRAGGMAFTSTSSNPTHNHWYYYNSTWGTGRTSTWTHAHWFRRHWGAVNGEGIKRAYRMRVYTVSDALSNINTIRADVWRGDVIQHVRNSDGETYHSQAVYAYPTGDVTVSEHDGLSGDNFYSLKSFLQRRINDGRGSDWVCVIQIKSGS
jgi:hypothetical protein